MTKRKLAHFAENLTFPHLFQYPGLEMAKGFPLKGKWKEDFFHNDKPLTVELGCGKGEYTVNLALHNPDRNYIGVDIKGARLWKGCKMVQEMGLANVAFIRTKIELIEYFFAKGEVSEIWLTFPDPQPKISHVLKRLSSPFFLEKYRHITGPGALIHLKTDNERLYNYTLEVIKEYRHHLLFASADIYKLEEPHAATAIQTFYEEKYRKEGIPIKYAEFILNDES